MCFNYKKAKRIQSTSKTRTAFANTYGDLVAKTLANWFNEVPTTRTERSFLFRCLDDYDEVMERSSAGIVPSAKRKKVEFPQLALELFPP